MKVGRPVYVYQLPVTGVFMYGTYEYDLYTHKHWKTREAAQRNADKYNKKHGLEPIVSKTKATPKPKPKIGGHALKSDLIIFEDHFKAIYEYVVKAINRNYDMPSNARLYWRNLGKEGSYISVLYGRGNELKINQHGAIQLRSQKFMKLQRLVQNLNYHLNPSIGIPAQTTDAARFVFDDADDIKTAAIYYKQEIAIIERAVKYAIKKFKHMGT